MKRAVILHGTDGNPGENWFPWLKGKLEAKGYDVWVPQLPECHTPSRETYAKFLLQSDFDFEDAVVIGHSSGAVEVLNILDDERFPKLRVAIAVSAWAEGDPLDGGESWLEPGQFDHLFPTEGFHFDRMKSKVNVIKFVHADDDPYCPLAQAQHLAKNLGADLTVVPNGKHLGSNLTEFTQLWDLVQPEL